MALINRAGREISAKVVYYGPGLSGKTTNLELLFKQVPEDLRGKMISMKTRTDRTLFFDLLPFNADPILDHQVRILLYTVPGQVYYNATRRLVLKGVDAIVFVADSQRSKLDENIESLDNLRANLADMGLKLESLPWVIQYNKRDLHDILSIGELEQALNPSHVPHFTAVAPRGEGVHGTLRGVIQHLEPSLRDLVKREVGGSQPDNESLTSTSDRPAVAEPARPSLDPPQPAQSRQPAQESELESFLPDPVARPKNKPKWEQPGETPVAERPAASAMPPLAPLAGSKVETSNQPESAQAEPPSMPPLSPPVGEAQTEAQAPPPLVPLSKSPPADEQKQPTQEAPPMGETSHGSGASAPISLGVNADEHKNSMIEELDLGQFDLDSLPDPLVVELPIRGKAGQHGLKSDPFLIADTPPSAREASEPVRPEAEAQRREPSREAAPPSRGVEPALTPAAPRSSGPSIPGGELIVQVPRRLLESGELRLRLVIAPEQTAETRRTEELLAKE